MRSLEKRVIITKKGLKGRGIYIGRPSVFGNPYPIKRSKYNHKVYLLEDSLRKYYKYFKHEITKTPEWKSLLQSFYERDKIVLDCWCINKIITSNCYKGVLNFSNIQCHGEVIAYFLFQGYTKGENRGVC